MEAVNLKLDSEKCQKTHQEMKRGKEENKWKDVIKQKEKPYVCSKHCDVVNITTNVYQLWHKHEMQT